MVSLLQRMYAHEVEPISFGLGRDNAPQAMRARVQSKNSQSSQSSVLCFTFHVYFCFMYFALLHPVVLKEYL